MDADIEVGTYVFYRQHVCVVRVIRDGLFYIQSTRLPWKMWWVKEHQFMYYRPKDGLSQE